MKIWTDREGNKLTPKEFGQRWLEGVQKITPFQQTKIGLFGAVLVLIGVVIGVITTFITKIWWLFIILLGSLLITSMTLLSSIQKYIVLKRINMLQEGINEQQSTNGS